MAAFTSGTSSRARGVGTKVRLPFTKSLSPKTSRSRRKALLNRWLPQAHIGRDFSYVALVHQRVKDEQQV